MSFLGKVKTFLGVDFYNQALNEVGLEEEMAARKVAMRYSRGSVGIQKGAFQTRKDLDAAMRRAGLDRNHAS